MKKVVITKQGKTIIAKTKGSAVVLFGQIGYGFIIRHKDNKFLSQFYHGKNGIYINSDKYNEICALEKKYKNEPIHKLLGVELYEIPADGRKKEIRKLPYFNIGMLV